MITGVSMGAPRNKNRALFLLSHTLGCARVILLEDDTRLDKAGWEAEWIKAAQRRGHANYAGDWMREHFLSATDTTEKPVRSHVVTAQRAAFFRSETESAMSEGPERFRLTPAEPPAGRPRADYSSICFAGPR